MQTMRNNTKTAAVIATVLLLMASAVVMSNVSVKAQLSATQPYSGSLKASDTANGTIRTQAFLSFRPNPIGVDQTILVNMWITPAPVGDRMLLDYKVTITRPDNTKDVLTMNSYPADGTAWFEYKVNQVGTWKLKFEFPGTYLPAGRYSGGYIVTNTTGTLYTVSAYFNPASTAEQTLTVQEAMVASWPPAPLPTDYWTRPASPENREWWSILGNYPWRGPGGEEPEWDALYPDTNPYWNALYSFTPWVQAPETAHIVWTRQDKITGIIGGDLGHYSKTGCLEYAQIFYAGRGYESYPKPGTGATAISYLRCYDLHTGEVYWEEPEPIARMLYISVSPSAPDRPNPPTAIEYGPGEREQPTLVYIGSGSLIKIDPWTGALTGNYSINPLTTGLYYMNGYALTVQDLGVAAGANRYRLINWTTFGTSATLAARIQNNITWPWSMLPLQTDFNVGIAANVAAVSAGGAYVGMSIRAASLKTGSELWNITIDETMYASMCNVADHGKIAVLTQKGYYLAYDLYSGKLAWKSEEMSYPWDSCSFGAYAVQSAYGMIYREGYSGVYAFNWTNGKIVWKYEAPTNPYETPYTDENGTTVQSFGFHGGPIANGKLYVCSGLHLLGQTITLRGEELHCINASTGEGIWNITGWLAPGSVADGYLAAFNGYDGYMYIFGKGKSATTVTASPAVIANGATVLIQGTVLDQSPAQPDTPCVSKDSMATQMEYLHMQHPIDGIWHNETITGVPVILTAIGSDGTVIDIGTTTTNGYYGAFGYAWTPPKEDTYTIMATFAGDDSYGSSSAATGLSVGPAPTATPTPTPQPQAQPDNTPLIYATVAIIIAVAIATILLLRKRP